SGLFRPSVVRAARISRAATVLDQSASEIASGFPVGIAFGGGVYLVLWKDQSHGGLFATRVNPAGKRIDDSPLPISDPFFSWTGTQASLVFDGQRFFVTWTDVLVVHAPFVMPQLFAFA